MIHNFLFGFVENLILILSLIFSAFTPERSYSDTDLQYFFIQHEHDFNILANHSTSKVMTSMLEKKLDVKITNTCGLDTTATTLLTYAAGMSFSTSSYKGYIHSEKPLSPIFNSLDKEPMAYQKQCAYKKIKDNWYLFYISYP